MIKKLFVLFFGLFVFVSFLCSQEAARSKYADVNYNFIRPISRRDVPEFMSYVEKYLTVGKSVCIYVGFDPWYGHEEGMFVNGGSFQPYVAMKITQTLNYALRNNGLITESFIIYASDDIKDLPWGYSKKPYVNIDQSQRDFLLVFIENLLTESLSASSPIDEVLQLYGGEKQ